MIILLFDEHQYAPWSKLKNKLVFLLQCSCTTERR